MERRLSASRLGLFVLTILVAALVGFAVRNPAPPDETVNLRSTLAPTVPPSTPAPTSTGSSSPAPSSPSAVAPVERVLLSGTTRTGATLRALAGDCDSGGAVLERSLDGGQNWATVTSPLPGLLRVRALSATEAWLVGTDKDCNARFSRSTDGGRTWKTKTATTGAWHLLPLDASQLHAPRGNVDSPCAGGTETIDLAVTNDVTAAVLCQGGQVHVTRDSGATWKKAGVVTGASALAFADLSVGFAAAPGRDSCNGTRVSQTLNRGATWKARGCVEGAADGVALAFLSKTVGLLTTVQDTWRTTDAGHTWVRL
ncbi:MAG: hypothetical protein QOJ49_1096 [Actinomycetota bacterium]|nr:hypothetical protein [Actinomycetota bacterium]